MTIERLIDVRNEADIVAARSVARETAKRLGFGMVDQSRITTAVSELARNIVRYAGHAGGQVMIREATSGDGQNGVEVVVSDQGPGIPDIARAMSEGFTTGGGLGLGLSGTKRLMDDFMIESSPGQGTIVTIRKWRR